MTANVVYLADEGVGARTAVVGLIVTQPHPDIAG
jgi:hypothetical protein